MRNVSPSRFSLKSERLSALRREAPWLAVALAVSALVGVSYLLTHPYPAYGSGFYLQIAEQIVANGYRLPSTLSNHTAGGIPFTYPPLMFYVSAVLMDIAGVSPIALSRYLPVIVTTLSLVPYYFISRELLDSKLEATLATTLLAVTPPLLGWHLSAGGLIRAPAFLFSLAGIYVVIRLFRSGSARLLVPAMLLFGLTLLTHLIYSVFLSVSLLVFYVALDRSLRGAVLGTAVGLGGIALAAPWWAQVIATHGVGVFAPAVRIDSWLFAGLHRFADAFVYTLGREPSTSAFFILAYAGVFYYLGMGRFLLPAWLFAPAMVLGTERFQFVAGSLMGAAVLCAGVRNLARQRVPAERWRTASRVAVAGIVLGSVAIGTMYGAGALSVADARNLEQQFVDHFDREAMTWVTQHTNQSVDFVVLGDAAEWFPVITDRSVLVNPWEGEWTSLIHVSTQPSLYEQLSTCETEDCVTNTLASQGLSPEYLYVPKGQYTVGGTTYEGTSALRQSLIRSDLYQLVFENGGACIFRITGDIEAASSHDTTLPRTGRITPS